MTKLAQVNEGFDPIQAFRDEVAVAKARRNGAGENITPQGYVDAIRELLQPNFKDVAWSAFVSNAHDMIRSMSSIEGAVSMVMVILPCSLTPLSWKEADLRAGKHFDIFPYSADQWQVNDPVYAAIPQEVWEAGRIDLPADVAQRSVALTAGLESARAKIKTLLRTENL